MGLQFFKGWNPGHRPLLIIMPSPFDIRQISRREFLKLSSAVLISLTALNHPLLASAKSNQGSTAKLGRLVKNHIDMFDQPSQDARLMRTLNKDEVFSISSSAIGKGEPKNNPVWYELNGEGFVHSGSVQPVQNQINNLTTAIPSTGLLAEVSVPYTDAVWDLEKKNTAHRLYYAATHWIMSVELDDQGQPWYKVLEDFYDEYYYINSQHLRIIPAEETTKLSPSVPAEDKRIEVRLADQLVIAYEGETQVQLFRCSAGITKNHASLTPTGTFRTDYKRPSRHMIDGNDHHANSFNLPGVPWISYLDNNGVSFHGTYWHNNFGVPMSHGCINLLPSDAKWIYRWTLPGVAHNAQKGYDPGKGTQVTIR
jgi:lipoprotein-anchoring transpeptidase ErfK/SrfK